MSDPGRWIDLQAPVYREQAVFCRVTGVRVQRRYWQAADGTGPYASPEAIELERRVAALQERWPTALRPDSGTGSK